MTTEREFNEQIKKRETVLKVGKYTVTGWKATALVCGLIMSAVAILITIF